jgi:hypothetical protein
VASLEHEIWQDPDGCTMVCLAGARGDGARALLVPGAKRLATFQADSHYDAMSRYHDFMGWPQYTTEHPSDREPYPEGWAAGA